VTYLTDKRRARCYNLVPMTKTDDLGPTLQIESVPSEWFKKNVRSKFEDKPYHFEPGSLSSKLAEYPALKFWSVQRGSLEYPGTWGKTADVLMQERDLPDNGRMLYYYKPLKQVK